MFRRVSQHSSVLFVRGIGEGAAVEKQEGYVSWLNSHRPSDAQIGYFYPRWSSRELLADKIERMREFHEQSGSPRTAWAESGGASLMLLLADDHPELFDELHLVCGFVSDPDAVTGARMEANPQLYAAVQGSSDVIDTIAQKVRVTTYGPWRDGVVPASSRYIPGARRKLIPMVGHLASIVAAEVNWLPHL